MRPRLLAGRRKGRVYQFCQRYPIFAKMGKNILLVAATAKEIAPFIKFIRKDEKQFSQKNIDILIAGIGLTATTYHLTKQMQLKKYQLAIQAGVAGSFDPDQQLGSVVAVTQDTIADQSVVELKKLKTVFDLDLVPADQHPFQSGWLKNTNAVLLKSTRLKLVKGISVNQISTDKKMIKFYRDRFAPVTESMEGAAFHYVCLAEKIPFIQLRSISNYIGERNKKNWDMMASIQNLNKPVIDLINNF